MHISLVEGWEVGVVGHLLPSNIPHHTDFLDILDILDRELSGRRGSLDRSELRQYCVATQF